MRGSLRVAALALLLELTLLVTGDPARANPIVDPPPAPPSPPSTIAAPARRAAPPLPPEYIVNDNDWIHLAYHPSMREKVRSLAPDASAFRAKLREELGADVLSSIEVRVAAAVPGGLARLAPPMERGEGSEGSSATFADLRLIVIAPPSPLANDPESLWDTLRHELARLAFDQALAGREGPPNAVAAAPPTLPAWLREGYAAHVAGDNAAQRAQTLSVASLRGRLLSLDEVAASAPGSAPQTSVAYAEAADFMRFLTQQSSRGRFAAFIASARGGASLDDALAAAYAQDRSEIELAWRKDLARRYSFMPVLLGSMIVWVAAGALLAARRARRARLAGERRPFLVREARHARTLSPEARVRIVSVNDRRAAASSRARALQSEIEALGEPLPPEAEIPKVEHEGQWHTLH